MSMRLALPTALLLAAATLHANAANQLVYVALDQPCRLLDSRTSQGGAGPLTAAHGNYTFGTSDADIESSAQHGNAAGCALPSGISAVSVAINQLDTTGSGNIRAWSSAAGSTGPSAGTAVYNPSVATPGAGQVLYSGAYSTIAVGTDGRFFLSVANGQLDMTLNVIGYWQPIAWSNDIAFATNAVALGTSNGAYGAGAFALGSYNYVTGSAAFGIGSYNQATFNGSTAIGYDNKSTGSLSIAIGNTNSVENDNSIAIGVSNLSTAPGAIAMGTNAKSAEANAFVFGDGSALTESVGQGSFVARASGGVYFVTNAGSEETPGAATGAAIAAGSGSWTNLSDRRTKDTVQPIDGRDVLERVAALPLATWHYKSQDPKYRHMGPMAQDFYAAFGLGESDTGIDTIDADGVALAAIQGLNARLDETRQALLDKDREIAQNQRDLAALRTRLDALEAASSRADAASH